MFGGGPWGGRARATATASTNASRSAFERLPIQAASISLSRSVSAARWADSYFECLVTQTPPLGSMKTAARGWRTAPGGRRSGGLDVRRAIALRALLDLERNPL